MTFDDECLVVDYPERRVVASFAIPKDHGYRIKLAFDLGLILIGDWDRGLSCYNLESGKRKWKNSKANKFTWATIDEKAGIVYLTGGERGGATTLDLDTGKRLDGRPEIHRVFHSPCGNYLVGQDYQRKVFLEHSGRRLEIPIANDAPLVSAGFGDDRFAVSFMHGPIYCTDLEEGELCGKNEGEDVSPCRPLGYSKDSGDFLGLVHHEGGQGCALLNFGPDCGKEETIAKFPLVFDGEFLDSGSALITSNGASGCLYDCESGAGERFEWQQWLS